MTNAELNNYILHYLLEDKTRSAIMLSAGWGTGKSYYIQNELIPFLAKNENGKHSCIVVSLYGISDVNEISKSLYFESRIKLLTKKSERLETGKFAVKTVAKGVTSFFGIDLSRSEKELKKLYESVDLSGKLIILEDIERSGINVLEVLGYVNNLVENDGVKVLLVANEDEIIKYQYSAPDNNGKTNKILDENSKKYLKVKEKTVRDTIYYNGNLENAIKSIIGLFDNKILNSFSSYEEIKNILNIMNSNNNLRTFTFACQKTVDIYEKVGTSLRMESDVFYKTIFYSIIAFSMKIKMGNIPNWVGTELVSSRLGDEKYPLYRFCYDYIRWQEFNGDKVQECLDVHKKMILYDRHGSSDDPDLNVVFNYYINTESDVLSALTNIENRLDDAENIPFYNYGKLVYYLIACNTVLEFNYTLCKEKMERNIYGRESHIDSDLLFLPFQEFRHEDERIQFEAFSSAIKEALKGKDDWQSSFSFSYDPKELKELLRKVTYNKEIVTRDHVFISKFNVDRLVEMFFECNPSQLMDFREILFAIYRHATRHDFLEDDLVFMQRLRDKIKIVMEQYKSRADRILLFQIQLLLKNLDDFIDQLS